MNSYHQRLILAALCDIHTEEQLENGIAIEKSLGMNLGLAPQQCSILIEAAYQLKRLRRDSPQMDSLHLQNNIQ